MILFFNIIWTVVVVLVLVIMSISTLVFLCWLLLINQFDRYEIARFVIIAPWVFIINKLLLFIKVTILGYENVDKKRKTLYICNHQSWFDITTFIRYSKATAVAKDEVKRIPFLGPVTVYTGVLYFKRENRGDRMGIIKEVRNLFQSGHSLCLFPEGTRSDDGTLLPPNFALIKLCYKMNVPVVPAAIEGTRFILPRKRFYFKFFQKVILKYNSPIYPENFETSDDFCNACWKKVEETHSEIQALYNAE